MSETETTAKQKTTGAPKIQGIGESKVFATGEGTMTPEMRAKWQAATCEGEPVPEHLWNVLPYKYTDQGQAEYAASLNDGRGPIGPKVSVNREPRDNKIAQYRDFRTDAPPEDFYQAPDPLKELADAHVPPGHKGRFLSQSRIAKEGGNPRRGFQIARTENGDPVRFGNMILGHIPAEEAQRRNEAAAEKSRRLVNTKPEQRAKESAGAAGNLLIER